LGLRGIVEENDWDALAINTIFTGNTSVFEERLIKE